MCICTPIDQDEGGIARHKKMQQAAGLSTLTPFRFHCGHADVSGMASEKVKHEGSSA
jgi:hypothetical protein